MSESFAELFEESLNQTEMRNGAMLVGTVVDIDNDKVIVSARLKSEGIIPKWQAVDQNIIKIIHLDKDKIKIKGLKEGVSDIVVSYEGVEEKLTVFVK